VNLWRFVLSELNFALVAHYSCTSHQILCQRLSECCGLFTRHPGIEIAIRSGQDACEPPTTMSVLQRCKWKSQKQNSRRRARPSAMPSESKIVFWPHS